MRLDFNYARRVAAAVLLLVFALPAGVAWAHAELVRASPGPDVVLPTSPSLVHLWFSEDLNGAGSRIAVWDRDRHNVTHGPAHILPGHTRQMEVGLKPLPPGSYLVLWTSVSADDGHLLRGSYIFSVKHPGPGPSLSGVNVGGGQGFPDIPGMLALLAHWIELLTAVTWSGAVAFSALVFGPLSQCLPAETIRREYVRLRRLVWIVIPVMIAASVVVLLLQAYSLAGGDWSMLLAQSTLAGLFADQYGQLWVARQVLALVGLFLTFWIPRLGSGPLGSDGVGSRSEFAGALTIVGAVYLYAFAASGHAVSVTIGTLPGGHGDIFSISIFLDWLHFVGDALWLGGQIAIVAVLIPTLFDRREGAHIQTFLDTLNRFSPAAYASIALFSLTGAFSGKVHIPSWYAFFNSVYGRTLIVKIVLIGLMMLVSTYTVFRLRPVIKRRMAADDDAVADLTHRLLRWLQINPVLGGAVLLATSVMFYYPVPPGFSPSASGSYTARGGGLTATMQVLPGRAGPNRITVVVHNGQGQLVRQAHVAVLTTMLDMPAGTGVASLTETRPGTFSGTTDLGMGGHWGLQILVYRPNGLTRMALRVVLGT